MRNTIFTRIVPAAVVAASLTAGIATALADFTVYENNFTSRGKYAEIIKSGGGKACDRRYRDKSKAMLASVRRGQTTCSFRPPVQSDGELPNHDIRVDGKVLSKTPKSVRGGAFLELTARAGGGGVGYTLRIFPQKQRFELSRGPGGGDFPVGERSDAIKKVDQRNQLRLVVKGATVQALVNGREVAKITDGDPGQVSGGKVRFAVGNSKGKDKDVVATFKKVAVSVPD